MKMIGGYLYCKCSRGETKGVPILKESLLGCPCRISGKGKTVGLEKCPLLSLELDESLVTELDDMRVKILSLQTKSAFYSKLATFGSSGIVQRDTVFNRQCLIVTETVLSLCKLTYFTCRPRGDTDKSTRGCDLLGCQTVECNGCKQENPYGELSLEQLRGHKLLRDTLFSQELR